MQQDERQTEEDCRLVVLSFLVFAFRGLFLFVTTVHMRALPPPKSLSYFEKCINPLVTLESLEIHNQHAKALTVRLLRMFPKVLEELLRSAETVPSLTKATLTQTMERTHDDNNNTYTTRGVEEMYVESQNRPSRHTAR